MSISAVHILGWFEGAEGYNVHTRNIANALERRIAVYRTQLPRQAGEVVGVAPEVQRHRDTGDLANVLICWGDMTHYLDGMPGLKIAYVVWETTKLPDSWLEPLRKVDRYWVPCTWCRDVLVGNGFDEELIDVVPHGADPTVFSPDAPIEPALEAKEEFKFVTVGRWQHRKGTADLLRAFNEEFAGDPDARLVLSCHNPHRRDFDLREELVKLNLSCLDQLTFLASGLRNEAIARVFAACDAAVFPTRSDPWGLPISEAMAAGLPVIATDFGGPADYMTRDTGYPLAWDPVDCPWMPVIMSDGDYGLWAEPDFAELRRLMREIYENRDLARAKGARAAAHIHDQWTWDHAAEKAVAVLRGLP